MTTNQSSQILVVVKFTNATEEKPIMCSSFVCTANSFTLLDGEKKQIFYALRSTADIVRVNRVQ